RVAGDDLAAHRVPHDDGPLETQRADQVVQVEDEVAEAVVGCGLAVAVPAQVEREDVEAVEQAARQVVERVRVVAQAVHDDQRWQRGVTPVAEVDAQRPAAEEALAELGHGDRRTLATGACPRNLRRGHGRRAHRRAPPRRSSATAQAVVTFNESTPGTMGMWTTRSAAARVAARSPLPSAPSSRAVRAGTAMPAPSAPTSAPSWGLNATSVKPAAR